MKQIILSISLMLMIGSVFAFDPEPIVVLKETVTVNNAKNFETKLAFAKGDLVIMKFKVVKDRNIDGVVVHKYFDESVLYLVNEKLSRGVFQYEMQNDDVLVFYF